MSKFSVLPVALLLGAAAFQSLPGLSAPATAAAKRPPVAAASARRGLAFAQQRCSGCHAVAAIGSSPNPESPPFADIANRTGVTQATLRQFLRDSHNYPAAMNFEVENARIRDLAAYIVTLKQRGYRPLVN